MPCNTASELNMASEPGRTGKRQRLSAGPFRAGKGEPWACQAWERRAGEVAGEVISRETRKDLRNSMGRRISSCGPGAQPAHKGEEDRRDAWAEPRREATGWRSSPARGRASGAQALRGCS